MFLVKGECDVMDIGEQVYIQSFKHDGSLHRTWAKGTVLEKTDERLVLVTYKTMVTESSGRIWQTREPAVCFFYPNKWYNIISMIRKSGVTFYCNIASPSLYDGEAIKNIDYDLDLKVYPNGSYEVLDESEFEFNAHQMDYPDEIKRIVLESLDDLIEVVKRQESPFNDETIRDYYYYYLSLDRQRLK